MSMKILKAVVAVQALIGMFFVVPVYATNDGEKEDKDIEQVLQDFKYPEQKYAPYEFYFFDQKPDTVGIKGQDMAHEVARKGFNPGYAHARTDYVGSDIPNNRHLWLSDSWFDLFENQLKQAYTDGTHFSFADEYGWPSFQAGGRVVEAHPELRAKTITYSVFDVPAGESISIPHADFAVAGKLVSTQNSSYVTFMPTCTATANGGNSSTGWYNRSVHLDNGTPWDDMANPYNLSCAYTDGGAGDRWAEFHPYIRKSGTYDVYATWYDVGSNATNAVYNINGTPVTINQRENYNKWNKIGSFAFESGENNSIKINNKADGKVVVDAIKLVKADDPTEYIVIDDKHSTNRKIGYLDSDTLSLIDNSADMTWQAPSDGAYRVYVFSIQKTRSGYDGSVVNYLDSSLAEKFIEVAYRPYMERFKDYMGPGKTINGVFSDHEGDYGYKMAYSEDLEKLFKQKNGNDMRPLLPLLIDRDMQGKDVKVRFDWFDAVSDLYAKNVSTVADYAETMGMYYTMHTWEEGLLFQAGVVGDYYKLTRGITLPGDDSLQLTMYNPVTFKETQSIADLEGRRLMNEHSALMATELYTPNEMKKQANYLASYGVGHAISHSLKMTREKAQINVTPDFYNIDPNWDFMKNWTDFVRRTSYINSNGHINAQVLLLNPMDSIWSLAEGDFFDINYELHSNMGRYGGAFPGEAGEINLLYSKAIRQLTRNRIEHLAVDKYYVNKMEVSDGTLTLDGRSFRTVVMPPMTVIDENVANKLLDFAKEGGYIYYLGNLPTGSTQNGREDANIRKIMEELRSLPTVFYTADLGETLKTNCPGLSSQVQFIKGSFNMLSHYRIIDNKHVVFVANNTDKDHTSTIYIPDVIGSVQLMDPQTGNVTAANSAVNGDGMQVDLTFAPYQTFYILIDPDGEETASTTEITDSSTSIDTGWTAYIDKGNRSESIEHTFQPVTTDKMRIVIQKGAFENPETATISEVTVNGGEVTYVPTAASGDNISYIADGSNDTSWQNSDPMKLDESQWIELDLQKETSVHSVAITSGHGAPLMSYRIEIWNGFWWENIVTLDTNSQPELNQAITYTDELLNGSQVSLTNWNTWSFMPSNFAGCIDYTNTITATKGERTVIELETVDGGAQLWVNGESVGSCLTAPFRFDITDFVVTGENSVRVRVANTIGSNKTGKVKGGLTAFRVLTTSEENFVADTSNAPEEKPGFTPQEPLVLPAAFDVTDLPLELNEPELETTKIDGITYDIYEAQYADFGPYTLGNQHSVLQPNLSSNVGNAFSGKVLGWWSAESYVNFIVYSDEERKAKVSVSYAAPSSAKIVLEANGKEYTADAVKTASLYDYNTVSLGIIPLKQGFNLIKLTQNGTTSNIDALLVSSNGQDIYRISIPENASEVASDDMSGYPTGAFATDSKGNGCTWSINGAVIEKAPENYSGNAVKISEKGQSASLNLDQKLSAPFIATIKFYHPGTVNNYAFYNVVYSETDYDLLGCNLQKREDGNYHIRQYGTGYNGKITVTETEYSKGWHEFAVVADNEGKVTYYIDGDQLIDNSGNPVTRILGNDQKLQGIRLDAVTDWDVGIAPIGYMTDIEVYKVVTLKDIQGIPIPENATEVASDDINTYTVNTTYSSSKSFGNWTVKAGNAKIVSNPVGGTEKAVMINASNDAVVYTLAEKDRLSAPFIATAKFYVDSQSSDVFYGIDYDAGANAATTYGNRIIGPSFSQTHDVGYYYIRNGTGNNIKTNVACSLGWHELAVEADSAGNITYYIDNVKVQNQDNTDIAITVPDGKKLTGIGMRVAWNQEGYSKNGYLSDLKFYKLPIDQDEPLTSPKAEFYIDDELQNGETKLLHGKHTIAGHVSSYENDGTAILAIYNNGVLQSVSMCSEPTMNKDTHDYYTDLDITVSEEQRELTAKLFFWNMDTLSPMKSLEGKLSEIQLVCE